MVGRELPEQLNQILGYVTSEDYATAQAVVEAADTVREAIETGGVLDRLENEAGRAEARAVLELIPPALDEAIIATLESAFERRLPVEVRWHETHDEVIEVRVSEEPPHDPQRVHIVFVSPEGDWFLRRLAGS